MADKQLTPWVINELTPILLVTDDDALVALVSLEASELSLSMQAMREISLDDMLPRQVIILDLDARGGLQAALYGGIDIFLGICRNATELPTVLDTRIPHLLERPFSTAELRLLLGQLRYGDTVASARAARKRLDNSLKQNTDSIRMTDDAVWLGNTEISLTPKEAALMRCLLAKRGETVPKQVLVDCLRTDGREGDSNKTEVYLCYLRRKLEKPTGRRLISTIRGVGYRLEWE